MPYLEILLPTGHRDKIEITNNSLLISVLEKVCIKRNLNIDYCYLVHNKTKIDLSAKFGMTKLINNSKLELIISPVSLIDNIQLEITLQLPNAVRVTSTFLLQESIWEILLKFIKSNPEYESMIFPENNNLTPVVFHLHYQIIGEYCLRNTSLASLGFRSGRAFLRLELREVANDEIKNAIETLNGKLKLQNEVTGNDKTDETQKIEKSHESGGIQDNTPSIGSSTAVFSDPIAPEPKAVLNEFSPFSMFPPNRSLFDEPPSKTPKDAQNKKSATLGEIIGLSLEHSDNDWQQPMGIVDFKFPDETAGKNLMEVDEKRNENFSISHDNRESVFFYRKQVENPVPEEEIPDSFFEITEQDLRQIIKSYRQTAESDAPLLTKALKEQLREAQFSKYQRCVIQFHFQDAYILQSIFQPKETIGDLYSYVKYYSRNVNGDFHLYTTPPKEILRDKESTLIKSGLVPMSKIYVSVKAREFLLGYFDGEMSTINDENQAQELVAKWMKSENTETGVRHQSREEASVCGPSNTAVKRSDISKSNKVPKWFHK